MGGLIKSWDTKEQVRCVNECLAGDEYHADLGGSIESFCGTEIVINYCECTCAEMGQKYASVDEMDLMATDRDITEAVKPCTYILSKCF